MINVFLSLPMSGREDEEVLNQIEEMKGYVLDSHIFGDEEIEFIHNLGSDVAVSEETIVPLLYLGEAIKKMAYCNVVMLGKGWNKARGCQIEKEVAIKYGIPVYHCNSRERMDRYVQIANSQ